MTPRAGRLLHVGMALALVLGVCAVLVAVHAQAPGSAQAAPTTAAACSHQWPDSVGTWQRSWEPYLNRVVRTAQRHADFTGSRINNCRHTFVIEGVGPAPADVAAVIAASPATVQTRWESVPFTAHQLDVAARAVMDYRLTQEAFASASCRFIVVDVMLDARTSQGQARSDVRHLVTNGIPVHVRFVNHPVVQPI